MSRVQERFRLRLAALLLALAAIVGLIWVSSSTAALSWILRHGSALSGQTLEVKGLQGSLWHGIRAEAVSWRNKTTQLTAKNIRVAWHPLDVLFGTLRLGPIRVGLLNVRSRASKDLPKAMFFPLRARIDSLQIDQLSWQTSADSQPKVLRSLQLIADYHPASYYAWQVERFAVEAPKAGMVVLRGKLADHLPFNLDLHAELAFRSPKVKAPLPSRASFRVTGSLLTPMLTADVAWPSLQRVSTDASPKKGEDVTLHLRGKMQLFVPKESFQLEGWFSDALPLALFPEMMHWAAWSGQFLVTCQRETDEPFCLGNFSLKNRLPIQASPADFSGKFSFAKRKLDFSASLLSAGNTLVSAIAKLDVVAWRRPVLEMDVVMPDMSALNNGWPRTQLKGRVTLSERNLVGNLSNSSGPLAQISARSDAMPPSTVWLDSVRVDLPSLFLFASGKIGLNNGYPIDLKGSFSRFNPAGSLRFYSPSFSGWIANGVVAGNWAVRGAAWPPKALETQMSITDGELGGKPIRLAATGALSLLGPQKWGAQSFSLQLTDESRHTALRLNGAWGKTTDQLQFQVDWRDAPWISTGISGNLSASGVLVGLQIGQTVPSFQKAWGTGELLNFRWRDWMGEKLSGRLNWGRHATQRSLSADRPRGAMVQTALAQTSSMSDQLVLEGKGIQYKNHKLGGVQLTLAGGPQAYRLTSRLVGAEFAGDLAMRGVSAPGGAWSGRIETFSVSKPFAAHLEKPVSMSGGFAKRSLRLEALLLAVGGGRMTLEKAQYGPEGWSIRGNASNLPVEEWLKLFPSSEVLTEWMQRGPLRLSGQWNLSNAAAKWDETSGSVSASLISHSDDWQLQARLDHGRITGPFQFSSPAAGLLASWMGSGWVSSGKLSFLGQMMGSLRAPSLSGELRGEALSFKQVTTGWAASDGLLIAEVTPALFSLKNFKVSSGKGEASLKGQLSLANFAGNFALTAVHFPVLLGLGKKLVLSGDTSISSQSKSIRWTGGIHVDEGLVDLETDQIAKLPEDVRLIQRNHVQVPLDMAFAQVQRVQSQDVVPSGPASPSVEAFLQLALGDHLRVRGKGLDARIEGSLNVEGSLRNPPKVTGIVNIVDGVYAAYGRNLDITSGRISFGGAFDNPTLDIVAMQRNQTVQAGVSVIGTLLDPRVKLVSDPPDLPDSEKLSWLLFGTGVVDDGGSSARTLALESAVRAVFDRFRDTKKKTSKLIDFAGIRRMSKAEPFDPNFGAYFPGRIASGLTYSSAISQDVFAMGKRLGKHVFVTYEQGLQQLWRLFRIQYEMTKRLSFRAQAGSDTAVDLLYAVPFD